MFSIESARHLSARLLVVGESLIIKNPWERVGHLNQSAIAETKSRFSSLRLHSREILGLVAGTGTVLALAMLVNLPQDSARKEASVPSNVTSPAVVSVYDLMLREADEIREYIISQGKLAEDVEVTVFPVFAPWGAGEVQQRGLATRDFPLVGDPSNQLTYQYTFFPGEGGNLEWPFEANIGGVPWIIRRASDAHVPPVNTLSSPWVFNGMKEQGKVLIQRRPPSSHLVESVIP